MLCEACLSICATAILRLISDSLCALVFLKAKSLSFMHAPKGTCKAFIDVDQSWSLPASRAITTIIKRESSSSSEFGSSRFLLL